MITIRTDPDTRDVTITLPAEDADLLLNYAHRGADAAKQLRMRDRFGGIATAARAGYPYTIEGPLNGGCTHVYEDPASGTTGARP